MRSRGFTLIELLVVIAIIAILASILFPVFAKAREKARQATCLSQIRQLATAAQMYAQDNNSRMPGFGWADSISTYIGGSTKMFFCPSDAANDADSPISYAYSGLLLRADGSGVNDAQILAPTEAGVFADASPSKAYPNGAILGGGGLQLDTTYAAIPAARHSKGVIIAFADGHAKYVNKEFNVKDMSNGVTRAFYMANALGIVDNPVGGISAFNIGSSPSTLGLVVGGDAAGAPILMAAIDAYKKQVAGFSYTTKGFNGITGAAAAYGVDRVWVDASGAAPGTTIAQDAVVAIIAKNSKIPTVYPGSGYFTGSGNTLAASSANINNLFTDNNGYSANSYQAYTYSTTSGSRTFFQNAYLDGETIGNQALIAANDREMVDKVANDQYGIGYCSAAAADPERVTIIGIGTKFYPNSNPKFRWEVPAAPTDWPAVRKISVVGAGAGTGFIDRMFNSATTTGCTFLTYLQAGPLFQASYYVP